MRVLQKALSLGSDYFSATFYQTYFYYKPSKYCHPLPPPPHPPPLKHIYLVAKSR